MSDTWSTACGPIRSCFSFFPIYIIRSSMLSLLWERYADDNQRKKLCKESGKIETETITITMKPKSTHFDLEVHPENRRRDGGATFRFFSSKTENCGTRFIYYNTKSIIHYFLYLPHNKEEQQKQKLSNDILLIAEHKEGSLTASFLNVPDLLVV